MAADTLEGACGDRDTRICLHEQHNITLLIFTNDLCSETVTAFIWSHQVCRDIVFMVIDLLLYGLWLLYFACGTLLGKVGHAILAPHAPWLVDHLRCDTLWSTDYPDACPWIDMTGSPDQQNLSGIVPPPPVSSTNESLQRPMGWGELCTSSCLHLERGHHGGKEMVRCLHCA